MAKRTPLETALATLGMLTRDELRELRSTIDDLLAVEEVGEQQPDQAAEAGQSESRGHTELKMITDKKTGKSYGPYKYLRMWKGGKLTSKYLGKASDE